MKIAVAIITTFVAAPLLAATPAETASLKKFLSDYCVKCHGAEKQKGDIRLDDLTGDILTEGTRWSVVVDQIRSGEMPPDDAKAQPTDAQRKAVVAWVNGQLGAHAQRRPNLGNLVPHELLFGSAESAKAAAKAPAPRLWRLSPRGYMGWAEDVARGRPTGLVQPFSLGPERGLKDFAELARVDEPTVEILFRNATLIVEQQTRHELKDGKVQAKNDTVREFVELMDPGLTPTRAQLEKARA